MKRHVYYKAYISGITIMVLAAAYVLAGCFGMITKLSLEDTLLILGGGLAALVAGWVVSKVDEVVEPLRCFVRDLLSALQFVVTCSALFMSVSALLCEMSEGATVLEACLHAYGIIMMALGGIVLLSVLQALMMRAVDSDESYGEASAMLPPLAAAFLSGVGLCVVMLVFQIVQYSYPLRTAGGDTLTWVRGIIKCVRDKDTPFLNQFAVCPLSGGSFINVAAQCVNQNRMAFIVCLTLPVVIVGIFCFSAKCAEVLRDKTEQMRVIAGILHSTVNKNAEYLESRDRKGYCPGCRSMQSMAAVLPFELDKLDVRAEDVVEGIQNHWSERCSSDAVVTQEELNKKPVTFVKPHAKVFSPSGTLLRESHYVCTRCGCTIAQNVNGDLLDASEVTTVHLFGMMNVGKTTLMALLYFYSSKLAAPDSYECIYWKKVLGKFPAELPEPTELSLYQSVPLALQYGQKSYAFFDVAGENSPLQSHSNERSVKLIVLNLMDPPSVAEGVETLKTCVRVNARKVVVCFSQCDTYPWDVQEMMSPKWKGVRNRKILEFLHTTPGFEELATVADSVGEKLSLNFTFVSATGNPSVNRKIDGKLEPKYLDELFKAIGG